VMFHKTERATGLQAVAVRERRERGHCLLQVERVLAQAVEKRQLPADTDTALATRALYAYIEGVMDQWVLDPGAFDLAAAAPALVDTMLAGLRAAPPRRVREAAALPGKRSLAASAKRRGGKA
jgi:TetR/AcrR family transcriptional regulator, acrAB operon repressor